MTIVSHIASRVPMQYLFLNSLFADAQCSGLIYHIFCHVFQHFFNIFFIKSW